MHRDRIIELAKLAEETVDPSVLGNLGLDAWLFALTIRFVELIEAEVKQPLSEQLAKCQNYAAIGSVVWKFIDRMTDVAECDPAEKILDEFVTMVMPHINAALKEQ